MADCGAYRIDLVMDSESKKNKLKVGMMAAPFGSCFECVEAL